MAKTDAQRDRERYVRSRTVYLKEIIAQIDSELRENGHSEKKIKRLRDRKKSAQENLNALTTESSLLETNMSKLQTIAKASQERLKETAARARPGSGVAVGLTGEKGKRMPTSRMQENYNRLTELKAKLGKKGLAASRKKEVLNGIFWAELDLLGDYQDLPASKQKNLDITTVVPQESIDKILKADKDNEFAKYKEQTGYDSKKPVNRGGKPNNPVKKERSTKDVLNQFAQNEKDFYDTLNKALGGDKDAMILLAKNDFSMKDVLEDMDKGASREDIIKSVKKLYRSADQFDSEISGSNAVPVGKKEMTLINKATEKLSGTKPKSAPKTNPLHATKKRVGPKNSAIDNTEVIDTLNKLKDGVHSKMNRRARYVPPADLVEKLEAAGLNADDIIDDFYAKKSVDDVIDDYNIEYRSPSKNAGSKPKDAPAKAPVKKVAKEDAPTDNTKLFTETLKKALDGDKESMILLAKNDFSMVDVAKELKEGASKESIIKDVLKTFRYKDIFDPNISKSKAVPVGRKELGLIDGISKELSAKPAATPKAAPAKKAPASKKDPVKSKEMNELLSTRESLRGALKAHEAKGDEASAKATRRKINVINKKLEAYKGIDPNVKPTKDKPVPKTEVPKDANGKRYTKRGVTQMLKELREKNERGRKGSAAFKAREADIKRLSKILQNLGKKTGLAAVNENAVIRQIATAHVLTQ